MTLLNITGFINLIGDMGLFIISIYVIFSSKRVDDVMGGLLLLIPASTILYYLIKTKFGYKNLNIADKIELENEALRKKIEQKKLIEQLEKLNENKTNN